LFVKFICLVRHRRVWDNLRKILLFNLPVNFAQGTSIFWAYVVGFHESPLTAIQVWEMLLPDTPVCIFA
jgi:magnesium-transporting ATPase (P-type)